VGGDSYFSDDAGERLSFIARATGSDWKYGDLECCEGGSSGRFAFPLERRSGKPLRRRARGPDLRR
jgi:hypothetical protein